MSTARQQILILYLATPDLKSRTIAWSLYDGASEEDIPQMETGDSETPPYPNVLAAMRNGWHVIQFPTLPQYVHGHDHETGHLPYGYILEKKVAIHE